MVLDGARTCRFPRWGFTLACAFVAALAPGCSTEYGFALEITVDFDSTVDDATLARVKSLAFQDSGDEMYSHDTVLTHAALRSERLLYYPSSNTRALTATITAEDADGSSIAVGMSSPLMLEAGKTSHVTITLSKSSSDGGVVDMGPAFYVAPQGNDGNAGTLSAPFATLARAQQAMLSGKTKTTYVRGGIYAMTATLTLTSADSSETWSYYPPDGYDSAILDGGASASSNGINLLTILGATHVTVDGLTLRNFQQWGIGLHGGAASSPDGFPQTVAICDSVLIENNVMDTGYTSNNNGFAGGGLWAFGQVTNLTVANNLVTNQNGGGIRVHSPFDSTGGPVSGLVIKNNAVLNTNRVPVDNGAIFVEDPSFSSTSIVIENNFVRDYQGGGTSPARDVGIYLDHGASNVTITGNIIGNTANAIVGSSTTASTQAILLGSSHNVTVTSNIIDLGTSGLILSLAYDYFFTTDTPMTGNVISGNIFIGKWKGSQESFAFGVGPYGFAQAGSDVTEPTITHNLYYNYGTGTLSTTGNGLADAAPVTGIDPMLSGTTYTLAATSPAYAAPISFAPIVGGWGPPGYTIPSTGTSPSY